MIDEGAGWIVRAQVIDAVTRFTAAFDRRDIDAMRHWFSEGGIWHRLAGEVVGHAGLAELIATLPRGFVCRHILSNPVVDVAGSTARCVSYVTVYRRTGDDAAEWPLPIGEGVHLVGDCTDELLWSEDRWRIGRRRVTPVFAR